MDSEKSFVYLTRIGHASASEDIRIRAGQLGRGTNDLKRGLRSRAGFFGRLAG